MRNQRRVLQEAVQSRSFATERHPHQHHAVDARCGTRRTWDRKAEQKSDVLEEYSTREKMIRTV